MVDESGQLFVCCDVTLFGWLGLVPKNCKKLMNQCELNRFWYSVHQFWFFPTPLGTALLVNYYLLGLYTFLEDLFCGKQTVRTLCGLIRSGSLTAFLAIPNFSQVRSDN